jgi:hypothetical protein
MKRMLMGLAIALAFAALGGMTEAWAHNPQGVPVQTPAPLQCTTPSGGWTIAAVPGDGGEFPVAVACENAGHSGGTCFLYRYSLVAPGGTPDHVVFAVSADQDLDRAGPSAFVTPPGSKSGDPATGFLAGAYHEYPVRVNPTPRVPAEISIAGPTAPRISTVLVKRGNVREACLIAGPGVFGSTFRPVAVTQTQIAAGGKCPVELIYDSAGNLADVRPLTEDCIRFQGPVTVQGQPLQDNTESITIGTGTSTCWGPPRPTPAVCICTRAPCP